MLDLILLILILIMVAAYYRTIKEAKKKTKQPWDPFRRYEMITRLRCLKKSCGTIVEKHFKDFEYVSQKLGKCPKCKGDMVIDGIFYEKKKTKKELEWEKELAKWQ